MGTGSTMASVIEYWPVFIAIIVVVAAIIASTLRRRKVEIKAPTLDDGVASPTLCRSILPETPLGPPLAELAPEPKGHAAVPAALGESDDLSLLKGVGPRLAKLLNQLGVLRFDQIAEWTPEHVAEVNSHLGTFAGRIDRDRWIDQARFLASGDIAGFEARFGKLNNTVG